MSENTVYFHALFFEQNIKSDFQCTKCRKQVYTHKVCQIEFTVRCTNKHWTTFIETGNMLTGKIIVRKESATVVVSFQCFIVKSSKQLIHIDFHAKTLCKFFKQIDPRIQIGSTVVTMYHSDEISGWCRNKVNFFVNFFQFFFQYDHRKHRSSGRYIPCADRHTVCRCHTGSGISLRRTEWDSCFQISRRIQQFCSFFRQHSCSPATRTFGNISCKVKEYPFFFASSSNIFTRFSSQSFASQSIGNIPDASPIPSTFSPVSFQ